MVKRWIRFWCSKGTAAWRRERSEQGGGSQGQALIIIIFGIFGLLILVGLAVDLGLYYVERVRITRAVDAAALAAAYELPLENAAIVQAEEYLLQNGYDPFGSDTLLVTNGVTVTTPAGEAQTEVVINTLDYRQAPGAVDSSYRIRVEVKQQVPVIFLRFAGFQNIYCYASAVAENINNLDIVLVFDKSGSMEFNTLCYGCWEEQSGVQYPSGELHPLPWRGAADWDEEDGILPSDNPPEHCGSTQRYEYSGHDYYFIEAEEYSYTNLSYDPLMYNKGQSFWVLQREESSSSSRDSRGAYIMHMPYPGMDENVGASGVTCRYEEIANGGKCWSGAPNGPYDAPMVYYDFAPVANRPGGYYIWVRGQAASTWDRGDDLDQRLFWGIDGLLGAGSFVGNCGGLVGCETGFYRGTGYNGANNNWQWRRLNDTPYYWPEGEVHKLMFWAGGCEFALDRIAITSNPNGSDGNPPGPISWNGGKGADVWANGRTGWACDRCDSRFAGYPGRVDELSSPSQVVNYFPICDRGANPDRRQDKIYDDEQPIRASVEAAKMFVRELLDPRYDQIGYVRYSSNSEIASELQCVRRLGSDLCTDQVIENTVISELNDTRAGGSTNIAGGMLDGLQVLSTQPGHYGRPGATHVMIVMTDGRANQVPNSECYSDPARQWVNSDGSAGTNAQDCVIYYAYEARNNNVVVYTITLGSGADFDLMQAVANMTGGVHRNADRPEMLPAIFEELYKLMFLKLVE